MKNLAGRMAVNLGLSERSIFLYFICLRKDKIFSHLSSSIFLAAFFLISTSQGAISQVIEEKQDFNQVNQLQPLPSYQYQEIDLNYSG